MRSYAWVQLQRGLLDLERCSFADAEDHYHRAEVAYSGYWLVKEHQAALMGARGDIEEAARLYEEIAARIPKPELAQALGKLYSLMGDRERSEQCYSRAEATFLESANTGEIHYYHHLADLYLHGQDKPVAALEWARKDWELRDNFSTQAVLALALYRNGKLEDAATLIDRALESGVSDVHVSSTAAKIYKSLGREDEAKTYAARTAQLGSVHPHFHVHH